MIMNNTIKIRIILQRHPPIRLCPKPGRLWPNPDRKAKLKNVAVFFFIFVDGKYLVTAPCPQNIFYVPVFVGLFLK